MLIRLNATTARMISPRMSNTSAPRPAITLEIIRISTTTDRTLTARSRRRAAAVNLARMVIPIAIGISTRANTWITLSNWRPIELSEPTKPATDRFTMTGRVNSASTELTAVSEMLSARSPLNRWL